MAVDTIATSTPATQTVADLGRLVKRKYPAYARIPDAELGRKVRAKYPAYRRFVDVPDTTAPDTVAPTPAATPAEAQVEPRRAIAEIRSAPAPAVAGPGSPPEFVRGFRGGLVGQNVEAVGRTAQAAADIAPMDALGGPVLGSALRGIARRAGGALVRAGQGQAQEAKVPSFKSVRSARELFDYLQFQAGQGIASTVPSVAGAAAGTLVAGPVVGAAVGAAVPAYALNFGDVAEEVDRALPKATASERAGISALIALPVTALDVLPSMRFGGKAAKKLMVQKLIAEASKRGLLERVLKEGGKGIAAEGVTEALQEVIQAVSVSGTAGKPLDQDELITRAVDAAIGGALAGGTIGGAIEAVPQRKGGPPSPASGPARPLANLASEEGRLRVQAPTPAFTPSVVEAAGVRANIEPPKNLSPQMAQTAREASIELGNTLSQIQQRAVGPVRFTDGGLKIEDAYIVPELVRVFPGDPNALRVTVVDRATGRMYSRALPNIGSLRSAMTVEAPREVSAAPAPTLPTEPLLPARGSVPVVEPEQVRAAAEGAKGRAVARAEADAAIPGRIAELKRLVAENPGDKRVKKWKRRIGRLERQIPGRATPTIPTGKETPSVLAKPATPVEESTKPAPPRPAPAAAAIAPARPAQPSEPVRPTPAPSGTEAGGPAAARPRIIVPGHTFSDEATARRIAVAIARSTPDSDAKVVKTKKGYEIEVNEDAGVSRLKKTPAPARTPAPVAAPSAIDYDAELSAAVSQGPFKAEMERLRESGASDDQLSDLVVRALASRGVAPPSQMAVSRKGGVERVFAGFDPSIIRKLANKLYTSELGTVMLRELLQNAVDSLPLEGPGKITLDYESSARKFTIIDNGSGMSPATVRKELVDLGGTLKRESAAGGFGLAKAVLYSNAESIVVETVAKVGKGKIRTILSGTGESWTSREKGMEIDSSPVPNDTPTGTTTTLRIATKSPSGENITLNSWEVSGFLRQFGVNHQLPLDITLRVDGTDVMTHRPPGGELEQITTLEVTGARIVVRASPRQSATSYVPVFVLNSGMPQFKMSVGLPSDTMMPERIVVDVTPTVSSESESYPFTTSRDALSGAADQAVKRYVAKDLFDERASKDRERLAAAVDDAPRMRGPASDLRVVDSSGRLSKDLVREIADDALMSRLAAKLRTHIEALLSVVSLNRVDEAYDANKMSFVGLGLGEGYLGINIGGKYLTGKMESPSVVLLNPLLVWYESNQLQRKGIVGSQDELAWEIAHQLASTATHEVIHQKERGHGESFAGELTRVIGTTARRVQIASTELHDLLAEDSYELIGRLEQYHQSASVDWGRENIFARAGDTLARRRRSSGSVGPAQEGEGGRAGRTEGLQRGGERAPATLAGSAEVRGTGRLAGLVRSLRQRSGIRPLSQVELGGDVAADFALNPPRAGRPFPSGRSFVEEFEDLARQGMSLEEATAEAKARSGGEPPAGLDLETRWSRVRREAQEALGQTDMFGGAALLGGGKPGAVVAPETPAEREAPPNVSEAAPRAEKPSEPLNVPLEGLWYWQGFQNRDVPRGAKPTQNPSELVNAAHVRMLEETRGGFDIDEVVRRPILVWRDVAGELGEAGRRYVIDGHHRAFMALQTKAKKLPAVEVFGNLAYARDQARTANMASVPNTFSEQTRIAREIRERGDSWEKVAAQLRVRVARVKAMVDFAHLDPGVRSTYFPSGNETVMLNGTAHGETVGRYAREMPELMTVDMQRKWLDQAVNDDMKPTMFADEVRQFFSAMTAAKQEVMDVGGVAAIRLSMTPKQFAQTSGRLIGAIEAQKRQLNAAVKSLESVAEMARGKGHAAASDFVTKELADIGKEGSRLIKAHKEIKAAIHEALMAGMRGERDLATSFDAIQKRVDEIVGSAPPSSAIVGEEGFIRIPDLLEALVKALRRLSGIVRRDPTVKQTAKPRRFARPAVVEKILNALKVAKPVREEQEALHTAELAGRVRLAISRERGLSGLERHRARRSAMAGEFSKPDFESIAKALSTENVRELIDMIYAHPALDFFEHDNAVDALQKIVGDKGVEVPQPRELELLEIVFGTELVEALTSLRPQIVGARAKLYALANISKIMRTAYDLSAPLRQGLYFAARFPKQWGKAFVAMHRFWATEENFQEGMEEIWHRPNARLYRLLRLAITRPGSLVLTAQEEAFFGARLLYKVPGIRRSDRAYSGFLNQLRADVMDALIELAAANGHDLRPGNLDRLGRIARSRDKAYSASAKAEITRLMKVGAEIAALVNAGTGRGDSKFISEHAAGLNAMFFSARLIKSRLHLLNPKHYSPIWLKEGKVNLLNPHNYVRTTKFVRHEYIKSSVLLAGAAHMVLTLAGWAGAQIERERLNADFGKIRVGKNVYDILGGLIQYVRLYPAVTKAMWDQLSGKKPRYSAADLLWMFTEHKLSPIADFVLNWTRGWKMAEGGTKRLTYQDLPKDLLMLFVPMIAEDFFEVLKNDPRQLPVAIPASAYGVSVQSYDKPQPKGRRKAIRVAP